MNSTVIIYDGNCRFCRNAVSFLKPVNLQKEIQFISSSDNAAREYLKNKGIDEKLSEKSVIMVDNDKVYTRSTAVIKALQRKGGLWSLTGILIIIPRFFRNTVYNIIASMR
jgi:predicted DCC family thiol-disulfide oxidoreductase YuxK